jgi:hypothetical protein
LVARNRMILNIGRLLGFACKTTLRPIQPRRRLAF